MLTLLDYDCSQDSYLATYTLPLKFIGPFFSLLPQVARSASSKSNMSTALGAIPPTSSGVHLAWWGFAKVSTARKDPGAEGGCRETGFAEPDGSSAR